MVDGNTFCPTELVVVCWARVELVVDVDGTIVGCVCETTLVGVAVVVVCDGAMVLVPIVGPLNAGPTDVFTMAGSWTRQAGS